MVHIWEELEVVTINFSSDMVLQCRKYMWPMKQPNLDSLRLRCRTSIYIYIEYSTGDKTPPCWSYIHC